MDNQIAVVKENPVRGTVPLRLPGMVSGAPQNLFYILRQGLYLVPVRSGSDEEVICQYRDFVDIIILMSCAFLSSSA